MEEGQQWVNNGIVKTEVEDKEKQAVKTEKKRTLREGMDGKKILNSEGGRTNMNYKE